MLRRGLNCISHECGIAHVGGIPYLCNSFQECNPLKRILRMNRLFRVLSLVMGLVVCCPFYYKVYACTSVLVSGKVSKDGRPFILKNRDTRSLDNLIMQVKGEKYRYIAVVAADDSLPESVWSGHNEKGFAIINTAAYNLNGDMKVSDERDGMIMRRALEICANVKDFENLIDTIRPRYSNSNFGVIDAEGGCAYYEVGVKQWRKFDANDPNVAPYGYLVRTNHGLSGDRTMDAGVERYMAINKYMTQASFSNSLDAVSILRTVPRILRHGLADIDLHDLEPEDGTQQKFFPFIDFIPRYLTASAELIQGVRKGEDPLNTVGWNIIGSPLATVAIPLLVTPSGKLPSVVLRGEDGASKLCHYGLKLKERLFPLRTKSRENYIDIAQLINKKGTGILQVIEPIESEVVARGEEMIRKVRTAKNYPVKEVDAYYKWVDEFIVSKYHESFGL